MYISHIFIQNFRSIESFEMDMGKNIVLIGENNTGKSNFLHAIDAFYKDNINNDDFRKLSDIDSTDRIEIQITFSDLSDMQKQKLAKYVINNQVKIQYIREKNKSEGEYHGWSSVFTSYTFPEGWDDISKQIIESDLPPNRRDLKKASALGELSLKFSQTIKFDEWINEKSLFISNHPEIHTTSSENWSPSNFKGFIGPKQEELTGSCIFFHAISDPQEIIEGGRRADPISEMIATLSIISFPIESQNQINEIYEQYLQQFQTDIQNLENRFQDELREMETTVHIELNIPKVKAPNIESSISFFDGVLTSMNKKGTGLQRYIAFKFLKIQNELLVNDSISFIFLIEEPESYLHPQIQKEIAGIIRNLSENPSRHYQIILTTHSPQFIDLLYSSHIWRFEKNLDCCTIPTNCMLDLTEIGKKIHTILVFNSYVNELFFARKVILVEGQSEQIVWNYLETEKKIQTRGISLIYSGGKGNILLFLDVLNKAKIRYTVLIDEDPYYLPHYKKENPESQRDKRKMYDLNVSIGRSINPTLGNLIIFCPDFDTWLHISHKQGKKKGKPTAAFYRITKIISGNPSDPEYSKIISFFTEIILMNFNEKYPGMIINEQYSPWQPKNPSSVQLAVLTIPQLKNLLKKIFIMAKKANLPISKIKAYFNQARELVLKSSIQRI